MPYMSDPRIAHSGSLAIADLARDLHLLGTAGRRRLKARLQAVGQPVLAQARRNAGWSTRIPSAISVRGIADESRVRFGLALHISAATAPHARAYEGISQQGSTGYFRHPVYGNTDVWVTQTSRPYAWPAVQANAETTRQACLAAYEEAARDAGFH
jgi:hypothetical protein